MYHHFGLVNSKVIIAKLLLLLVWLGVFLGGLKSYEGTSFTYTYFSCIYLALLFNGIKYASKSYIYFFLSIFLWLGFWFKLALSLFFLGFFSYGEPVGNFSGSPHSWDLVLDISSIGALGFILASYCFSCFQFKQYSLVQEWPNPPMWYSQYRHVIWSGLIIFIIAIACLNAYFGIHIIGIAPKTIFLWPINALMSWFINIGAALAISVLMAWDIALNKKLTISMAAMLMEAFLNTVSIMSRALYIWHTIPQLLSLSQFKNLFRKLNHAKIAVTVLFSCLFFLLSVVFVTELRDKNYTDTLAVPVYPLICNIESAPKNMTQYGAWYIGQYCPKANSNIAVGKDISVTLPSPQSFRLVLIYQLFVNRWIGLEGVMAISSYEPKSFSLLYKALWERRALGSVDMYQVISNSGYQVSDLAYQFSSLPGAIGFSYYSGSLVAVFFFILTASCAAILFERLIFLLSGNPIYCSIFGALLANTLSQFGVAPLQDFKMYLIILFVTLIIWGLQYKKN